MNILFFGGFPPNFREIKLFNSFGKVPKMGSVGWLPQYNYVKNSVSSTSFYLQFECAFRCRYVFFLDF